MASSMVAIMLPKLATANSRGRGRSASECKLDYFTFYIDTELEDGLGEDSKETDDTTGSDLSNRCLLLRQGLQELCSRIFRWY